MNHEQATYQHPLVRDGESQEGRQNAALLPENVKIDGRSWEDLLNYLYELSRHINFFSQELKWQGDWQQFFRMSGPVQLAIIAKLDIKALASDYEKASDIFLNGVDRGNPKPLFDRQFEIAVMANNWYKRLAGDPSGYRQEIAGLTLTNLQLGLHRLIALGLSEPALAAGYEEHYFIDELSSEGSLPWELVDREILPETFPWGSRNQQRRELEKRLSETFQVFYGGLEHLQEKVKEFFPKTIAIPQEALQSNGAAAGAAQEEAEPFQKHEPHLGLMYSFLKLFEQVKRNLNEHAKTHLDFYYKKVLRLAERPAQPDQAYLVFEVADPLTEHLVEKNTPFSGGDDSNGVEQVFDLDEELLVQRARIASLRTLYLDKQEVQKVVNGQKGPFTVIGGAVAAPQANSADGLGTGFDDIDPPSWPTLGALRSPAPDPDNPDVSLPYPDARLGIALAAPILYLREGYRRIRFKMLCDLPDYLQNPNGRDFRRFKQAIDTLFYFTPQAAAAAIEEGLDPQFQVPNLIYNYGPNPKKVEAFRRFMEVNSLVGEQRLAFEKSIERRLAFKVSLSGEAEWIQPHEVYMSVIPTGDGQALLEVNIHLGLEGGPVLPFVAEDFGFDLGGGVTDPVCKLELDPSLHFSVDVQNGNGGTATREVSVYQAFREMTIADISIDVEVDGVHSLVVQSVDGVLDPGGPFEPFGAEPKKGANFYIGSEEVFHKKLVSTDERPGLRLHLTWDNLPESFFEHYRMYGVDVFRDSYKGAMHMLYQGNWIPLDPADPEKRLFSPLVFVPSADGLRYEVRDGNTLVLEVLGEDAATAATRIDLGNALALAMDEAHYEREDTPCESTSRFIINKILLDESKEAVAYTKHFPNTQPDEEAIAEVIATLSQPAITLEAREFGNLRATPSVEQLALTAGARNGFMALRLLRPDFYHKQYPKALSIQSTAQALALQVDALQQNAGLDENGDPNEITLPPQVRQARFRSNNDPTVVISGGLIPEDEYADYLAELPNEPFSPALNAISVDYRAEAGTFDLEAFHLYPFEEGNHLELDLAADTPTLLPKFEDPEGDVTVEKQGNLYIGLDELSRGNTLSLLVQVAEATADPDLERAEPSWHYLKDNKWVRLEPDVQVLSDETEGLIRSGIVKLAIPYNINRRNTILPAEYYWLKVSAPLRSAATSETLNIFPQAGRVTFAPAEGNDLTRLSGPLAAESIAEFVEEDPSVKSVLQPYHSFAGRPAEKEEAFYVRVSEHLRHKGRAITLYDYERILLEAFPQVFRLKCVTHTLGRRGEDFDYQLAPSYVTVAVIPDLRQQDYAERLEPKFSVGGLLEMEEYLRQFCSPFVRLQVLNPRYEKVSIEAKVKFQAGKSPEFYRKELKKAIMNFLSPWAFKEPGRISFGGEVFGSYVLNFMEKQPYVDYITDFVMKDDKGREVQEASARSARSILVSGGHTIHTIE